MSNLTLEAGLKHVAQRDYQSLHTLCIERIKLDIRNPIPYFFLGCIASHHGNLQKAEELFQKAIDLNPKEPHYSIWLARQLSEQRRTLEALNLVKHAQKLKINKAYLADNMGVIFSRAGDHKTAIHCFKRAIALNDRNASYLYNLGASAQFIGDFRKAEDAYSAALEIDPSYYQAMCSRVSLRKQTQNGNSIENLEALFNKLSDDEDARHRIGHALAKSFEDLGQYEASYNWLVSAKAQKKKIYPYDRGSTRQTFAAAADTTQSGSRGYTSDITPIFITGLPRTGTTLVDRIISSHSKVESLGELNIFAELIKSHAQTGSNLVMDRETFEAAQSLNLTEIGRDYIEHICARANDSSFIIDKMPFNFFYAALISRALPNARIITLRRGAMDSCLSNFRQLLSIRESFYGYTYDIEDTAFFYRQFDQLIRHWRKALSPSSFMEVRYEDIVFDQDKKTRSLLEFCGLDFEEACLRFHENDAPVSTASSVQVRQPLYSGSIGRWKKYGRKLDTLYEGLGELADT